MVEEIFTNESKNPQITRWKQEYINYHTNGKIYKDVKIDWNDYEYIDHHFKLSEDTTP